MPGVVEFLSPALDRILRDQGFAETHCHVGAAVEFPVLWVGAMRALASLELDPTRFVSPGSHLDEGRDLASWLVRAAVARYVLAAFLARGRGDEPLDAYLFQIRDRFDARRGPVDYALLLVALADLFRGTLGASDLSFRDCQGLYAQMTELNTRPDPRRLGMVQWDDPVSEFFAPLGHRRPTPEMRFVGAGLEYLETGVDDTTFAQVFWQTLRIRTLFYRHIVQRPMTPGLQWFIRFYGRISPVRGPLEPLMFASAEEVGGIRRGLRSLEVRTSPDRNETGLLRYVEGFERFAKRARRRARRAGAHPCEYGLVLHFTKDRGGGSLQGYPGAYGEGSHAAPHANASGYRFGTSFFPAKLREAQSFAWVLRSFPLSLQVLRGLDVCTDELGVPTWVLLPVIRHVQEAGMLASRLLRQELSLNVPPLRTTVHVGEDFVHLLSGLRRVDEAIRYVGLREGDRIGHAVALGVDPREWSGRGGLIPVTSEERLLDLAWEWNWYARGDAAAPGGRLPRLEREIFRLAGLVFGPRRLLEAHLQLDALADDLHDPDRLGEAGFPDGPIPLPGRCRRDPGLGLLVAYLTSPGIFRRGREIEWVDPAADGETLVAIQAGLRRKVADLGITVEVNPSSNLLIGDLQDLRRHPLWRLRPPQGGDNLPPVSVCIGSDDPVTFATRLPEEYQLLQDALVSSGLGEEESRVWLERTRASGMETRFTLPRLSGRKLSSWWQTDDFPLPLF
jgi:hypothetical protein